MNRVTVPLSALLRSVIGGVGLDGGFLLAATVLLAVGSSLIDPRAPWFVVGGLCLIVWAALTLPVGKR